jgi:hypothetical protein
MQRILKFGAIGFLLVPLLTAIAYFAGDTKLAWSVGLGGLIPFVFFGVTVIAMLWSAPKSPNVMAAAVLVLSLVKMFGLLGALVALKGQTFYSLPAFAGTLLVGTISVLVIEAISVSKARVSVIDLP